MKLLIYKPFDLTLEVILINITMPVNRRRIRQRNPLTIILAQIDDNSQQIKATQIVVLDNLILLPTKIPITISPSDIDAQTDYY